MTEKERVIWTVINYLGMGEVIWHARELGHQWAAEFIEDMASNNQTRTYRYPLLVERHAKRHFAMFCGMVQKQADEMQEASLNLPAAELQSHG